jgi:hypothetical protein
MHWHMEGASINNRTRGFGRLSLTCEGGNDYNEPSLQAHVTNIWERLWIQRDEQKLKVTWNAIWPLGQPYISGWLRRGYFGLAKYYKLKDMQVVCCLACRTMSVYERSAGASAQLCQRCITVKDGLRDMRCTFPFPGWPPPRPPWPRDSSDAPSTVYKVSGREMAAPVSAAQRRPWRPSSARSTPPPPPCASRPASPPAHSSTPPQPSETTCP